MSHSRNRTEQAGVWTKKSGTRNPGAHVKQDVQDKEKKPVGWVNT
jgi:hypothetical protein